MDIALSESDIEQCIEELASGALTKRLAERYGIGRTALRTRLIKHPRYAEAIKAQAEAMVEDATAESLDPMLPAESAAIARARLRVDAAHKWAAARDPATWSAKPDLGGLTVNVQVVAFTQPAAVEHEGTGILSNSAALQHVAHTPHNPQLELVPVAQPIPAGPDRSPVAPRLVDSGGDQSASSVVSEGTL